MMRQFHKMDPDELDFSDRNELGLYMMLLDLIFDDAPYLLIRAIKLAARMRLDDAPEKELLSLFNTLSQILQELVSSDGFITDCFARIGKGLEKLYDQ